MPRIVHEACSEYEKGKDFTIVARFEDESQLFDPKVMYRNRPDAHWRPAAFVKDPSTDNFKAVIEAKELRGPLEYFLEVFDEYGNGPARMGSPEAPIRVVPARTPAACQQVPKPTVPVPTVTGGSKPGGTGFLEQPQPQPVKEGCDAADRPAYCEPWLWIAVGTVTLAGAGLLTYFLVFPGDGDEPEPRDSVKLIVVGPDPTASPLWGRGR
jgi:hypothetical protein